MNTDTQTLDDRRDCHIDLFRRFFLFFVGRGETKAFWIYLFSLLFSYRTTRNHVVIISRENERKTHYYYYYYYS